ncbi:MAG: DUF2723 domain-containing protein, partial [candidate division Zixibacteria bacterium]|nr:DUF2723 domain-containing protein [candidate division Zixibacteria bacterium]
MKLYFDQHLDKVNLTVGIGVWAVVMLVYWLTKAATMSFWDCGEFITAAYRLAIPHPPGSPLYITVGRIFSLIPVSADIGVRLNFLSGFCSAFTALFCYLSAVRILRHWFVEQTSRFSRLLVYGGAVSGALFAAFSLTNWTNSIEAEVYGMAMMITTGILWLTLVYLNKRGSLTAERIMLMIVFAAFLGIGVHMTTFIILPVAALLFVIQKDAPASAWFGMALFFVVELYMIFALSSRPGEIPFFLPVVIVFVFYLFYIFSFDKIPAPFLYLALGFLISVAPIYVQGLLAITTAGGAAIDDPGGVLGIAGLIGQIAFGLVVLYGLFCLVKYRSPGMAKDVRAHYKMQAWFILAAALMVFVLYLPKGYLAFLLLSALALIVLIVYQARQINWPILVALVSISTVVIGLELFFYAVPIGACGILVLGFALKMERWKSALMILVVAALGFSINLFVPIRSSQDPYLDENKPSDSYQATINFLERKQYGSMGMVERMFSRRAEWSHQFGVYRRMGFWNFFHQQYGLTGPRFVILFLLGLFGLWEIVRRRPAVGLPFTVLLLLSTVGLVLYMNFADGTRMLSNGSDYIEVRERDYFFTPGFILFGVAIGFGIAIILEYLREGVRKYSTALRRIIIVVPSLVLLLLPLIALKVNYNKCDRSRDYMPWDYAWNLLDSAEKNAVLFTNGDNDTFPLWCMQGVYGIRTDVTVVCLALANTKWYIKQLQTTMGLDLGWSEEHIDSLRPFHIPDSMTLAQRSQYVDKSVFGFLGVSDTEMDSLYAEGVPYGATFRFSNMVQDKVLYLYQGKRPIYYAVSMGGGTRYHLGRPIDSRLSLDGMMWRLNATSPGRHTDVDASLDFFTGEDRFQARGVNDPTIHKNETTRRLTSNYANGFLMVADSLRTRGDLERAQALMERAVNLIPYSGDAVETLAQLYAQQGMIAPLTALI